jgi:rhamnose transport system ATP-binding protein
VMDEPTAALTAIEVERLFTVVRTLRAEGAAVLFISHRLEEVFANCQRVTIMRDGRFVRTDPIEDLDIDTVIRSMVGRDLDTLFPKTDTTPGEVVLSVEHLSRRGEFNDVSFTVRRGEIVALAGLVGAGRTELARAVFGAQRPTAGEVHVSGRRLDGGPRERLRAGVAMIPESRKDDGLLLTRSVTENVTLASLPALSRGGFVRRRAERDRAREVLDRWAVRAGSAGAPVATLSGGNQQKVLFARMLLCGPTVLIADEPTRGVDVGARRAIYDALAALAQDGLGVLLISSELEEVLGLAHRVLVMRAGRIVDELAGEQMTESAVLGAAFAA